MLYCILGYTWSEQNTVRQLEKTILTATKMTSCFLSRDLTPQTQSVLFILKGWVLSGWGLLPSQHPHTETEWRLFWNFTLFALSKCCGTSWLPSLYPISMICVFITVLSVFAVVLCLMVTFFSFLRLSLLI